MKHSYFDWFMRIGGHLMIAAAVGYTIDKIAVHLDLPGFFVSLVVAVGIIYGAVFRIIEDDFRKQDPPLYHITVERTPLHVGDDDKMLNTGDSSD